MSSRWSGALALYVLAVAVLLWLAVGLWSGGLVAPVFLLAPVLALSAGRLWKTGEGSDGAAPLIDC
ncbi:hypothetical protein GCM10008955_41610 [Deinococcus malanensis]|uniref:Uncharacterized protein n=1 Tax=Deinococcus malanensis TaxID=1706855 RepID=A0ABQ2F2H9_9DEIO|nr:hypothetical protein [Deinococcus malanensis]GGK43532.1 hypothetical protein GCM10008955_41610 [Deinococcus malanensis]